MLSAVRRARAWCVLLALAFTAAFVPAQAHGMDLMVAGFGRDTDSVRERAYVTSGYVGARYAREIVNRGAFYTSGGAATSFDYSALDRWVDTALQFELKPYLTLTNVNDSSLTSRQRLADPSTYGAWCGEVANRYSRPGSERVLDYSVWNEPNLPGVGNLPASSYLNYYAACRFAIRQVNPNANVYYGELSTGEVSGTDACQWLIASTNGATVGTEGVAVHPYQFTVDPTVATPGGAACQGIGRLSQWAGNISSAHLQTTSGARAPLLVSEFGYCSQRTPAPAGDPYVVGMTVAACPQNAGGVASVLPPATHAQWLARAWTVASNAGAVVFNYHTLASRNHWEWRGRDRSGNYNGGYMWESGLLDNPTPAGVDPYADYSQDVYGNSVNALRAATGTVSPAASVSAATSVDATSATVNGAVDPKGWRTTYHFEYGPTTAYGSSTPEQTVAGSAGPTAVSAAVTGLLANRELHVRLVVSNRAGNGASGDTSFRTALLPRAAAVNLQVGTATSSTAVSTGS